MEKIYKYVNINITITLKNLSNTLKQVCVIILIRA